MSLQRVSQSAESSAGHGICFPFLGPQSELQMGMETLSPSGQEVWIPVPATVVPMTSLSHFLSHCLLVSEHRKLRSSGTKPASKPRSIRHASFKTGRSRSRGTGKIQASIHCTQMESLSPLLTPLLSFTHSCIPVCFCYTMSRSDKTSWEREHRKGERDWERQVCRGQHVKAGTYSSEWCGAKQRMRNIGFPLWVVPSQGPHKGTATGAFLLLVWRGGKSYFLYLNLSQGKPKDPSDVWLPSCTPTSTFPPAALKLVSHLRNTPHPVLNPLRKMKNFGLFFTLVS